VATVLQSMKECGWIHLACHGIQDATSPTDNTFLLADGRLTLHEIMKQYTQLAVLSACQTTKGHIELSEETIHLAAGMLMAGYGNVVGQSGMTTHPRLWRSSTHISLVRLEEIVPKPRTYSAMQWRISAVSRARTILPAVAIMAVQPVPYVDMFFVVTI